TSSGRAANQDIQRSERRSLSAHQEAEPPTLRSSPINAININDQRFIFKRTTLPNTNTRPTIAFRTLYQFSSHRILVNVIYFLHEHAFAENWQRVAVVFPERVFVTARSTFPLQLPKGGIMAVLFQMVNYSPTDYSID